MMPSRIAAVVSPPSPGQDGPPGQPDPGVVAAPAASVWDAGPSADACRRTRVSNHGSEEASPASGSFEHLKGILSLAQAVALRFQPLTLRFAL